MKMLTLRIPEELHKALKVKCVMEDVEMNAVVTKLIEDYVKEGKAKPEAERRPPRSSRRQKKP